MGEAAIKQFGTVLFAGPHIGIDLLEVLARDHGADTGFFVQRIAERDFARDIEDAIEQFVADVLVHDQAGTGNAALAGIVIDAIGDAVGGGLQIRIGKDDLRTLATQLQPDALDLAGGDLGQFGADADRPGESHHIGARVFGQRLAGRVAIASDDVENAIGEAGFASQFGHHDRCARGEFGGFQHHRAAGADRPRHALGRDDEGKIPRGDNAHHTDRLAQDQAEAVVAEFVMGLAFERPGHAGGVVPKIGAIKDFAPRLGNGLAHFEAFGQRKRIDVLNDQRSDAAHDGGALAARHARPGAIVEGLAGGCDCGLDVFGRGFGPGAHDHARVAGTFARNSLARGGGDRAAADHHLVVRAAVETGIAALRCDEIGCLVHDASPKTRQFPLVVWYRMVDT